MTFTGNMRDGFWPNLRGLRYFFRIFTDVQSQTETQKMAKIEFSNFENSNKKRLNLGLKVF